MILLLIGTYTVTFTSHWHQAKAETDLGDQVNLATSAEIVMNPYPSKPMVLHLRGERLAYE